MNDVRDLADGAPVSSLVRNDEAAFSFRRLERTDLSLLADWLRRPHVAQWWRGSSDLTAVEAEYGPMIDGSDPTEGFIAVGDGTPFAFLQRYRFDENPAWQRTVASALAERAGAGDAGDAGGADGADGATDATGAAAGIDYLIGDQTMTGRGLGKRMIATFVDLTWDRYPDITAVIVDVDQGNDASWRALEGAGFRRSWSGELDSDDPSDEGPSYLYVKNRSGT